MTVKSGHANTAGTMTDSIDILKANLGLSTTASSKKKVSQAYSDDDDRKWKYGRRNWKYIITIIYFSNHNQLYSEYR